MKFSTKVISAIAAGAVLFTGAIGTGSAIAQEVPQSEDNIQYYNPMDAATPAGSENGFTIRTVGDAELSNSETEGSVAVGGALSADTGQGQGSGVEDYKIFQSAGGSSDYALPSVDEVPTRLLTQSLSEDMNAKIYIDGSLDNSGHAGVAKIASPKSGAKFSQAPGASGTLEDESDSTHIRQIVSETNHWQAPDGNPSMRVDHSVNSYFTEDHGTLLSSTAIKWSSPTIDNNDQNKAITLNSAGANRVTFSELNQAASVQYQDQFSISGYNKDTFLVVNVSLKDIVNGSLTVPTYSAAGNSPDGEGISYVLWDMSAISGPVNLISTKNRIRGAFYAPYADITIPNRNSDSDQFEGQLVAHTFKNKTTKANGMEQHTNLFKGRLRLSETPVAKESGGFKLKKVLSGVEASAFPVGTMFGVTASWSQDGAAKSQNFALPVDGSVVQGPQDLPMGTVVSFSENTALMPKIDGYTFTGVSFSAHSVTVGDGSDALVTVTNTFTKDVAKLGGFKLTKVLKDDAGLVPLDTSFAVDYFLNGATTASGTLKLKAGDVVEGPQDLPVGTKVSFREQSPAVISGGSWGDAQITPGEITVGDGSDALVTVTNTFTKDVAKLGGFKLKKMLSGIAQSDIPSGTTFTVTATWVENNTEKRQDFRLLSDGTVVEGPQTLPIGTVVTLSENDVPSFQGYVFTGARFSSQTVTIGEGTDTLVTVTNSYQKTLASTGSAISTFAVIIVLSMVLGMLFAFARRVKTAQ